MEKSFKKIIKGYKCFKKKYASNNRSVMKHLAMNGQNPEIMIIACCDSRADPAIILQCDPGDLFVVRNVANIVPPYQQNKGYHGTSAALEFGICYLNIKHLILLGHSQCGGISALMNNKYLPSNDFIKNWVSIINLPTCIGEEHFSHEDLDNCAKSSLHKSYNNCITFPWIKDKIDKQELTIDLWFFNIQNGEMVAYDKEHAKFIPLDLSKKLGK